MELKYAYGSGPLLSFMKRRTFLKVLTGFFVSLGLGGPKARAKKSFVIGCVCPLCGSEDVEKMHCCWYCPNCDRSWRLGTRMEVYSYDDLLSPMRDDKTWTNETGGLATREVCGKG